MSKKFWIFFAVLVVGVLGFAVMQSKSKAEPKRKIENPKIVQTDDHIRGKVDSKVYFIEYADFECISCNQWEPRLKEIEEEYGDRVAFIFRNFPITSAHVNALAAARTAEAANLQGKFWEMHDLLFSKYNEWKGDNKSAQGKFESYAEELGLDMDQFRQDYKSEAVLDRVNSDAAAASELGVTATPTFFINGELVETKSMEEGLKNIRKTLDEKLSTEQ
jgi:protein-disulfide isomerase